MIIVWGPEGDPPIANVIDNLAERDIDVLHIENRDLETLEYDVELHERPTGWMVVGGLRAQLDEIDGFFLRPATSHGARANAASGMLTAVAASVDAVVVNRPWAGRSNWSKPFQLRTIAAAGLLVPDTIVTTDPFVARQFLSAHGRLVYKSVSGIRSIVATIDADGAARLDDVRHGPVQLQQWIDGVDVRVHVVGDHWFATTIESPAADYRYAGLTGAPLSMVPTEIPRDLGHRLVALTKHLGLVISGIDLRTANGDWWCFEVNPSPGFTYYEDHTGQPITEAVADLLIGR